MKAIKKIVICMLAFGLSKAYGQIPAGGFKIGDTIPNLTIQHMTGKGNQNLQIKDLYQNGLLIIDFWATWCPPCIKEMNFLDSLKQVHPTRFKVLMVSNEKASKVLGFLEKQTNKHLKDGNLNIVSEDTLLNKLFPHKKIPHNVWVDKDGVVRAITTGQEVTALNIVNFNTDVARGMKVKKDKLNFSPAKAFHVGDSSFTYRSIITPHISGINAGTVMSAGTYIKRYLQYNQPILRAYWSAYSNFATYIRYNLIEVHTKDSVRLFEPSGKLKHLLGRPGYESFEDWWAKNTFCYNLTLPKAVSSGVFAEYMYSDLERQFNITAKIESRKIPCTIVKRKSIAQNSNNDISTDTSLIIKWLPGQILQIRNATIGDIVNWWFKSTNEVKVPNPFVVDVKQKDNVRIDADFDFSEELKSGLGLTSEMLYARLKRYGFSFETEIRPYPILVLRDK